MTAVIETLPPWSRNLSPAAIEHRRCRENARAVTHAGGPVIVQDIDGSERTFSGADKEEDVFEYLSKRPFAKADFGGQRLRTFELRQELTPLATEARPEVKAAPAEPEQNTKHADSTPAEDRDQNTVAQVEAKPQGVYARRSSLIMVRASDVEPERISWLWPNRFALGKFSLIAGNPGLGKSQLTVHLAAQVTTGGRWPNGEGDAPFGSVIILSVEDDAADTLVPRLIAAGADRTRIHIVEAVKVATGATEQDRQFDLTSDVQALCDAIDQIGDVQLVIIDPITAYLGSGRNVDSHKNAEVRAALAPLQAKAAQYGFAAVGVSHLNKGGGTEALMRVLGSLAFVAAARVAFLVVGDSENERSLFIPMKNNIGVKRPGLAFRLVSHTVGNGIDTSCIEWDADEISKSADEALAAAAGRDFGDKDQSSSVGEAVDFLRDVLTQGPVAAKEVQARAKEAGISKPTLKRAKKSMGVKAHHRGDGGANGHGEWVWEMAEPIIIRSAEMYD